LRSIIIIGSARDDGNTAKAVELINSKLNSEIINLNDLDISYFDYSHSNQYDDFIPTAEKLKDYDQFIFATPVYWYSMSAIMKTFFDRMTDLVTIRKDIGRSFKGKKIFVVSTSSSNKFIEFFVKPFEATADYFDMTYSGNLNLNLGRKIEDPNIFTQIDDFVKKIIN
jgi:multimeric flavodoxin WrbA